MKSVLVSLLFTGLFNYSFAVTSKWDGRIFKTMGHEELTFPQLTQELSVYRIVILGEKHSTQGVQNMQANVITNVVKLQELKNNFTVAWEFLNVKDQDQINSQFALMKDGKLTATEFIKAVMGNNSFYTPYAPVLESAAAHSGKLLGINLTREEKQPVSRGGIGQADPSIVPPGYEKGSANYYARFVEVMGGHTPEDKMANYFDAQCLTDDVMAYHTLKNLDTSKVFVIAGHFHTDYDDGVVQRLAKRAPNIPQANVRIVDAADYATDEELTAVMNDATYGDVANYVIYVNEPKRQR